MGLESFDDGIEDLSQEELEDKLQECEQRLAELDQELTDAEEDLRRYESDVRKGEDYPVSDLQEMRRDFLQVENDNQGHLRDELKQKLADGKLPDIDHFRF